MAEATLEKTVYELPDCCQKCEHKGSPKVNCPTNVALGALGRISVVVLDKKFELDSLEDAATLAGELPKLSKAAAECGSLLAKGVIARPFDVTTDLSLTKFTVHSPTQTIPPHTVTT